MSSSKEGNHSKASENWYSSVLGLASGESVDSQAGIHFLASQAQITCMCRRMLQSVSEKERGSRIRLKKSFSLPNVLEDSEYKDESIWFNEKNEEGRGGDSTTTREQQLSSKQENSCFSNVGIAGAGSKDKERKPLTLTETCPEQFIVRGPPGQRKPPMCENITVDHKKYALIPLTSEKSSIHPNVSSAPFVLPGETSDMLVGAAAGDMGQQDQIVTKNIITVNLNELQTSTETKRKPHAYGNFPELSQKEIGCNSNLNNQGHVSDLVNKPEKNSNFQNFKANARSVSANPVAEDANDINVRGIVATDCELKQARNSDSTGITPAAQPCLHRNTLRDTDEPRPKLCAISTNYASSYKCSPPLSSTPGLHCSSSDKRQAVHALGVDVYAGETPSSNALNFQRVVGGPSLTSPGSPDTGMLPSSAVSLAETKCCSKFCALPSDYNMTQEAVDSINYRHVFTPDDQSAMISDAPHMLPLDLRSFVPMDTVTSTLVYPPNDPNSDFSLEGPPTSEKVPRSLFDNIIRELLWARRAGALLQTQYKELIEKSSSLEKEVSMLNVEKEKNVSHIRKLENQVMQMNMAQQNLQLSLENMAKEKDKSQKELVLRYNALFADYTYSQKEIEKLVKEIEHKHTLETRGLQEGLQTVNVHTWPPMVSDGLHSAPSSVSPETDIKDDYINTYMHQGTRPKTMPRSQQTACTSVVPEYR